AVSTASATESPPCPQGLAVPTMPGPIEQRTASHPCSAAQTKAAAVETHATLPSMHAPTATVVSTSPRSRSARTVSERETGSAPPGTWTYATLRPSPSPAAAGATWLCKEQQTTGRPPNESSWAPSSSAWETAYWSGVYGSFITC